MLNLSAVFTYCIEYADGASLVFECIPSEIVDIAERYSDGYGYIIYEIKEIKQIFKEKKNEKV